MSEPARAARHRPRADVFNQPMGGGAYSPFSNDPGDVGEFYRHHSNRPRCDPERELRLAVLEEALFQLPVLAERIRQKQRLGRRDVSAEQEFTQLRMWFASTSIRHPYGVECLCDVLGLSVLRIREEADARCEPEWWREHRASIKRGAGSVRAA